MFADTYTEASNLKKSHLVYQRAGQTSTNVPRQQEFIKERVAIPLLTFLIHVSSARASLAPGKSRWKINATIFIHLFFFSFAFRFHLIYFTLRSALRLVSAEFLFCCS